jgi:hypothetical protein
MKKGYLFSSFFLFKYIRRNKVGSGGYETFYGDSSTKKIFKIEIA